MGGFISHIACRGQSKKHRTSGAKPAKSVDDPPRPSNESRTVVGSPEPDEVALKATALRKQATMQLVCHMLTRDQTSLDTAISHRRQIVDLYPTSHPDLPNAIMDLATCLSSRAALSTDTSPLSEAIELYRKVLDLRTKDHPDYVLVLDRLSASLYTRYQREGNQQDLEAAVSGYRLVISSQSERHLGRPKALNDLAETLLARYERLLSLPDLEESIKLHREALDLHLGPPQERSVAHSNLGLGLMYRFEKKGENEDLMNAIEHHRRALILRPTGNPTRHQSLYNLAQTLRTRSMQLGDEEDLNAAIDLHSEGLQLRGRDHPGRSMSLNSLGACLLTRAEKTDDVEDLDNAIKLLREALTLVPAENPRRALTLTYLAKCYSKRFEKTGDMSDLSTPIDYLQEAASITPPKYRGSVLSIFAKFLSLRFTQLGNEKDLKEAIRLYREALSTTSDDSIDRTTILTQLATDLTDLYHLEGDARDLNEAISRLYKALETTPTNSDPDLIAQLANCLHDRYKLNAQLPDIMNAVRLHREALTLPSPVDRASRLSSLAACLHTRYHQLGVESDLEDGVKIYREILVLQVPVDDHPRRPSTILGLVALLWTSLDKMEVSGDSQKGMEETKRTIAHLFKEATTGINALPSRIECANSWRSFAEQYDKSSQLDAYIASLDLVDSAVSQGSTEPLLINSREVASDAAALAIAKGDLPLAVTLLERGRVAFFPQTLRNRVALDSLKEKAPELAERFAKLRKDMKRLGSSGTSGRGPSVVTNLEDDMSHFKGVSSAWLSLLKEIRARDGLQSFLLPTPFSLLKEAAKEGPIILINISFYRCDAIIVFHQRDPVLVPLPDVDPDVLDYNLGPETTDHETIQVLQELWRIMVAPVIDVLRSGSSPLPEGSRVWWCPTGAASGLPLHAAGPYTSGQRDLPYIFVSSYTPTLDALVQARKASTKGDPSPQLIVVGATALSKQDGEMQVIKKLISDAAVLEGAGATRQAVISSMSGHSWVHLACDSRYKPGQGLLSHFTLTDGTINVLDLIKRGSSAGLVVVSGYRTEKAEESDDEVIPLPSGLMFAGCKSVVGTLWEVPIDVRPVFADDFYRRMLEQKDAAAALRKTITEDGDKYASLARRINFIHYGI